MIELISINFLEHTLSRPDYLVIRECISAPSSISSPQCLVQIGVTRACLRHIPIWIHAAPKWPDFESQCYHILPFILLLLLALPLDCN